MDSQNDALGCWVGVFWKRGQVRLGGKLEEKRRGKEEEKRRKKGEESGERVGHRFLCLFFLAILACLGTVQRRQAVKEAKRKEGN